MIGDVHQFIERSLKGHDLGTIGIGLQIHRHWSNLCFKRIFHENIFHENIFHDQYYKQTLLFQSSCNICNVYVLTVTPLEASGGTCGGRWGGKSTTLFT